ncbi:Uncharacterized protein PECH_008910 [Penicillium ucsense]|uniref:Uncharacterized protein n=1 Tax=Penicillium ucsense TaxID=2839758 RepID=A0A8J8WN98_9EURO|nr:Uncharacterized protein PECM_004504 [Penicillium ucsense]KAF7733838.1 Uncharacterized protein PECH_008910 [Penicillium ucsense]
MQFSPIKEGRRILGDRDSNACLSPAHHSKSALGGFSTPVKRTLFTNVSPKKLLPSPIFAGQKRTREQLDEEDVNAPRERRVEDSPSTLKNESQRPVVDCKETEDPIPNSTSQPEHEEPQEDNITTLHSASHKIHAQTSPIPENPDARRIFIQTKAALLRKKLQSAMRNNADNHIDRRVSDLEEHRRKVPRISMSALSFSSPAVMVRHTYTPSQLKTPRIGSDPQAHLDSTPCQQTPDLPQPPSSIIHDAVYHNQGHQTPPHGLGSPMQLSSPPATVVRHTRTREKADGGDSEKETTSHDPCSPSQRGDAVDGLLKLMSTSD